jgi:hypothetical protein
VKSSQESDFTQISQYVASAEKKLASRRRCCRSTRKPIPAGLRGDVEGFAGIDVEPRGGPRTLPGRHVTIIEFAEKQLGPEFKGLIALFNRMRRKRHETIYQVSGFISHQDAENALETGTKYLAAIRKTIQGQNPQIKLL